jgi:hypothetical protein
VVETPNQYGFSILSTIADIREINTI